MAVIHRVMTGKKLDTGKPLQIDHPERPKAAHHKKKVKRVTLADLQDGRR